MCGNIFTANEKKSVDKNINEKMDIIYGIGNMHFGYKIDEKFRSEVPKEYRYT